MLKSVFQGKMKSSQQQTKVAAINTCSDASVTANNHIRGNHSVSSSATTRQASTSPPLSSPTQTTIAGTLENGGKSYPVDTSQPNKGRLCVKVIEARGLLAHHSSPKPYCVVEFEKSEFVTREALSTTPVSINKVKTSLEPQLLYSDSNISSNGIHQMTIGSSNDPLVIHSATPTSERSVEEVSTYSSKEGEVRGENHMAEIMINPVWKHEATFDVARPDGELTITIWDRVGATPEEGERFLGQMKMQPPRINGTLIDHWFRVTPRQWKETVKGDIRIQVLYKIVPIKPLTADDFVLLKVVGKGSFGKVLQVKKKDTGRIYAMKVLVKKDIIERREIAHTLSERNVLIRASSSFLVGLKFSFQTPEKLYLVLDYMNGGELFYHLQKEVAFSEERAKFYTAELTSALEHLHQHNIVYRDLKPENILLDSNGHIALTDFGLCKENLSVNDTTNTFCGTAEYLAPEVLTGQGYGKAVDWWSLGILFYEMCTGLPPFYSENTNLMYRKILHHQVDFPPEFSTNAISFTQSLLERDPKRRLGGGATDADELRRHVFFAEIHWDKLLRKEIRPPFKPKVASEVDTSNFDPVFTDSVAVDSMPNSTNGPLSETLQNHFKGFTYTNDEMFLHSEYGSFKLENKLHDNPLDDF